jgi:hypothetical protein
VEEGQEGVRGDVVELMMTLVKMMVWLIGIRRGRRVAPGADLNWATESQTRMKRE